VRFYGCWGSNGPEHVDRENDDDSDYADNEDDDYTTILKIIHYIWADRRVVFYTAGY
jgi:hypothetical protein